MIRHIVSVRDAALGAFLPPFFVPAIGIAVRQFGDEVKKADSPMHSHPSDYELYHFGHFDDAGSFELLPSPSRIARGADYINQGE